MPPINFLILIGPVIYASVWHVNQHLLMMIFLIIDFLLCRSVLWLQTRKFFFSLWWTARMIISGTWISFQWHFGTLQATYSSPPTAPRQTSRPVPATHPPPPPPPLHSSYILSIRCVTSYTPLTCKSQHDELLSLSSLCKVMVLILLAFWHLIVTLKICSSSRIGWGDRGSTVVKVLCYKSEGCWFDPSWCRWKFSLT